MIKILFVGDKPSTKNTTAEQAFVGTHSHTRLLEWQKYMFIKPEDIEVTYVNSVSKQDVHTISSFTGLIIALGYDAGLRVKNLAKECYHLPHPSPRNRMLNDKGYELDQLRRCKQWIYMNCNLTAKGA